MTDVDDLDDEQLEKWMLWTSDNAAETKFGGRPNGTPREQP